MNLDVSMQSLKNLLSFPFHDPKWQEKFLIGSGLLLAGVIIPLLPWFVLWGYGARLIRAGARNEDAARLPAWDEWGELLLDGLRLFGASFILTFPGTLFMLGGWAVYMIFTFSTIMGSERYGASSDPTAGVNMLIGMGVFFIFIGIGMVLSIIGGVLFPAAAGHIATQRKFGVFFQVGQWWKVLRANLSGFFISLFLVVALYMTMMLVMQVLYMTIILCMVIPIALAPFGFYILVIYARMIGQAYGEGAVKAGILSALDAQDTPVEPAQDQLTAPDVL